MKALIDTRSLRRALAAVVPHVRKDTGAEPGGRTDLALLRFTLTPKAAWVQASDAVTSAIASVEVSMAEGLTGDPYEDSFEITPEDAATILAAFRSNADTEMPSELSLTLTTDKDGDPWLELQDVSGLIPGKTLVTPRAPRPDNFPNVMALVCDRLDARHPVAVDEEAGPVGKQRMQGLVDRLKPFAAAQRAYKSQLLVQATQGHRALFVSCGPDFAGMVIPSYGEGSPEDWHAGLDEDQKRLIEQLRPLGDALKSSNERRSQRPSRQAS
jgi:hypothetical protein